MRYAELFLQWFIALILCTIIGFCVFSVISCASVPVLECEEYLDPGPCFERLRLSEMRHQSTILNSILIEMKKHDKIAK